MPLSQSLSTPTPAPQLVTASTSNQVNTIPVCPPQLLPPCYSTSDSDDGNNGRGNHPHHEASVGPGLSVPRQASLPGPGSRHLLSAHCLQPPTFQNALILPWRGLVWILPWDRVGVNARPVGLVMETPAQACCLPLPQGRKWSVHDWKTPSHTHLLRGPPPSQWRLSALPFSVTNAFL